MVNRATARWFALGGVVTFLTVAHPVQSIEAEIRIDGNLVSHRFYGFGTQVWPTEISRPIEKLLLELDIDYVRLSASPNWSDVSVPVPADMTVKDMDEFVESSFRIKTPTLLTKSKQTFDFCKQHGINILLLIWAAPKPWQPVRNQLLPEHIDDFARLWGSVLHILDEHGIRPDFIEISNEPEGDWNTYIPPDRYSQLVKQVRAELDRRGFKDIQIVGPGVWSLIADKWINALDNTGVTALGAWSAHNYENQSKTAESVLAPFVSAAKRREKTKPIFITEYSTKLTRFADVEVRSNDDASESRPVKASFSMPYAVQVFQNTLVLINRGANAVFYWEAVDHTWTRNKWGLVDTNGNLKPVYKVLATLYPKIPDGAAVLKQQWDDPELTVAAFKSGNTVIIALANITDHPVIRDFSINQLEKPRRLEVNSSDKGSVSVQPLPESSKQNRFRVIMGKQSSATLMLQY